MYCKKCGTLLSYCARFTGKRLFLLITKQVKKHMQYQHVFYVNFSDFLALLLTHIVCLKNHHSSSINQTVCFSSGSLICCESPSKALEVHMIHPKNPRRYQKKKHVTTCSRVLSHFEIWDRSIFDHPRWDVWIHCTFVPCVETAMTDCKQNRLSFRMFQCMSYTSGAFGVAYHLSMSKIDNLLS